MKRLFTLFLLTSLLSAFQCGDENAAACPSFVDAKIAELQAKPKQNPAAEITEYTFQGAKVYLVSSDCCDQFEYLYNACGDVICAPTGGITGKGDGQCPDFSTQATDARVVWRDPR